MNMLSLLFKLVGVVVAVALLVGCETTKTIVPTPVLIPIVVTPEIVDLPTRPELDVDKLSANQQINPVTVVNAYRITVIQLRSYAQELEDIVAALTSRSTDKTKLTETVHK